jgi:hypothetical protein
MKEFMSAITTNWSQPPPFPIHRFTVDEYHRMIQAGVLTEDNPVELLEGFIVPKMPHNPRHDSTIDNIQEIIRNKIPAGWRIRVQSAITTNDSEPEPDLVIVPGPAHRYGNRHPGAADHPMVIEVADSSLARDRIDKGRLYARAGFPIYWIINLLDSNVEVYTQPSGPDANPGYRQRKDYERGDAVPLIVEDREVATIPVDELLS